MIGAGERAEESIEDEDRGASISFLTAFDEFTRRLAATDEYGVATATALEALDDLFGFASTILLVRDPDAGRLFAIADNGYPVSAAGAEVVVGHGVIGTAAATGQVVCVPNSARSRTMQAALRDPEEDSGGPPSRRDITLPGLPDPESLAAVPLETGGKVTGVLYLESDLVGTFVSADQPLLRVVGRHIGAALAAFGDDVVDRATAEGATLGAAEDQRPTVSVTYYHADDSVFIDDAYLIKGAAGRIVWKLLGEHAATGRTEFTNRELRLDENLGLPAGADNLESRLLVLRRRVAGDAFAIGLERVGRGRMKLSVAGPLRLSEVATGGPMAVAYASTQG